ncbi:MAG: CPBP family intramembrane metalloprotease [Lachnospiraceae bacterium]|nr:CPBP family intramembrane metalloprotease [Lachnospiraceae bacterium]
MKNYIRTNIFPIIIEVIFIISCCIVPREYYIYTNFCFYLILVIYFWCRKDFSLKKWSHNLKSGKKFWTYVILTALGFIGAFVITMVLESIFSDFNTGMIGLRRNSWISLIIFTISTVLLPPIVEETFFRKNMISFENKVVLIITTLLGMLMYALEHSLAVWGIILTMIWALPLSISYIKTKNVYVPMTAHFIGNLFGNGIDIIFTITAMISNK